MTSYRAFFLKTCVFISALSSSLAFARDAVLPTQSTEPMRVECKWADPVAETNVMVNQLLEVLRNDQSLINTNFPKVEDDIAQILAPKIDIQKIGAFVAGPLMNSATEAEKRAFEKELLRFFINSYSTAFRSFTQKVRVIVYPMRPGMDKKDTMQVNTVVVTDESGDPNSMIPVALVVTRDKKECQLKYVDFVVDNVTAVGSVQSQIAALNAQSLTALTEKIKQHNDAVLQGM